MTASLPMPLPSSSAALRANRAAALSPVYAAAAGKRPLFRTPAVPPLLPRLPFVALLAASTLLLLSSDTLFPRPAVLPAARPLGSNPPSPSSSFEHSSLAARSAVRIPNPAPVPVSTTASSGQRVQVRVQQQLQQQQRQQEQEQERQHTGGGNAASRDNDAQLLRRDVSDKELRAMVDRNHHLVYVPTARLLLFTMAKAGSSSVFEWLYAGLSGRRFECRTYMQNLRSPCWRPLRVVQLADLPLPELREVLFSEGATNSDNLTSSTRHSSDRSSSGSGSGSSSGDGATGISGRKNSAGLPILRVAVQRDPMSRTLSLFHDKFSCARDASMEASKRAERSYLIASMRAIVGLAGGDASAAAATSSDGRHTWTSGQESAGSATGKVEDVLIAGRQVGCMQIDEFAEVLDRTRKLLQSGQIMPADLDVHVRPQQFYFDRVRFDIVVDVADLARSDVLAPVLSRLPFRHNDAVKEGPRRAHQSKKAQLAMDPETEEKIRRFAALSKYGTRKLYNPEERQ